METYEGIVIKLEKVTFQNQVKDRTTLNEIMADHPDHKGISLEIREGIFVGLLCNTEYPHRQIFLSLSHPLWDQLHIGSKVKITEQIELVD